MPISRSAGETVLVVGATGQLGAAVVVRRQLSLGIAVKALVRSETARQTFAAAVGANVRRFVFVSVPVLKLRNNPRVFRFKRETEAALAASNMETLVLRAEAFMDVQFAMMGSAIPLRGSDFATVLRPFGFVQSRFSSIRRSIEQHRIAHIAGDGKARHAVQPRQFLPCQERLQ